MNVAILRNIPTTTTLGKKNTIKPISQNHKIIKKFFIDETLIKKACHKF